MIIKEKISANSFGSFVKVVVDIKKEILSADCELHLNCAEELVKDGSSNRDLWGANVYPENGQIDFISLINIKPEDNNHSLEIKIPEIIEKVEAVIKKLLF